MSAPLRRDFPLRFVDVAAEDGELYRGCYVAKLNEIVGVALVPPISDRARSWPPPRIVDEPSDVREARLELLGRQRTSILADDAAAGTSEVVPGGVDLDGEPLPARVVFFVDIARFERFEREIATAITTRDALHAQSWVELADLEVVRHLRHAVIDAPAFPVDTLAHVTTRSTEPIRPDHTCPRCGGHRVRGGKFGGRSADLYDFYCTECELLEDKLHDAPDFQAWWQRWHPRPR